MTDSIMYHDGNRHLQDQFDSRRISDRLEEKLTRTAFTADDKAFIESALYFFLATADADGRPDCSFKGGMPGFVRVSGRPSWRFPTTTATACSRASATCWSIRMSACCSSTCTSGRGGCASTAPRRCSRDDPLLGQTVGAQMIVRVTARAIFPNCPRYIPKHASSPSRRSTRRGRDTSRPSRPGRVSTSSRTRSIRASRPGRGEARSG